jgi:phosphatidylinositol alpha-mannosyltransferase
MVAVTLIAAALGVFALQKIGLQNIASALISSDATHVVLALAVMCGAMALRGVAWLAILRAALPRARVRLVDAMQGTFIGVLMSSTLPARLGEPSRALVVARRTGRPREHLPVVLGTIVSQTFINLLALLILGAIMLSSVHLFSGHQSAVLAAAIVPVALLAVVVALPWLLRGTGLAKRVPFEPLRAVLVRVRNALARVRAGLTVFRQPRNAAVAVGFQLAAWGMQAVSCYLLLVALGLDHRAGFAAAAAVLFAVNITAVVPATPANLGVFQAACATVLHAGWHVSFGDGVAYGVILQAVEVATAVLMGGPALLKEGMSWREIKLRAMHTTPVKLPPLPTHAAGRGAREVLESES